MLEQKFSKSQKKWDEYLVVCERLGKEPDEDKMPIDDRDFPYEVQLAFFIHSLMPDRWEGMSGSYLGKEWSAVGTLLDTYKVEERKVILFFIKAIDNINSRLINKSLEEERKKRDKKSPAEQKFPKSK